LEGNPVLLKYCRTKTSNLLQPDADAVFLQVKKSPGDYELRNQQEDIRDL